MNKKIENMSRQEAIFHLKELWEWVNSNDCITQSTDYTRGYKAGFNQAKEIVEDYLSYTVEEEYRARKTSGAKPEFMYAVEEFHYLIEDDEIKVLEETDYDHSFCLAMCFDIKKADLIMEQHKDDEYEVKAGEYVLLKCWKAPIPDDIWEKEESIEDLYSSLSELVGWDFVR